MYWPYLVGIEAPNGSKHVIIGTIHVLFASDFESDILPMLRGIPAEYLQNIEYFCPENQAIQLVRTMCRQDSGCFKPLVMENAVLDYLTGINPTIRCMSLDVYDEFLEEFLKASEKVFEGSSKFKLLLQLKYLFRCYRNRTADIGDIKATANELKPYSPYLRTMTDDEIEEKIISRRDGRMFERFEKIAKTGASCFMAVGVLHLSGLLSHLYNCGYKLRSLDPIKSMNIPVNGYLIPGRHVSPMKHFMFDNLLHRLWLLLDVTSLDNFSEQSEFKTEEYSASDFKYKMVAFEFIAWHKECRLLIDEFFKTRYSLRDLIEFGSRIGTKPLLFIKIDSAAINAKFPDSKSFDLKQIAGADVCPPIAYFLYLKLWLHLNQASAGERNKLSEDSRIKLRFLEESIESYLRPERGKLGATIIALVKAVVQNKIDALKRSKQCGSKKERLLLEHTLSFALSTLANPKLQLTEGFFLASDTPKQLQEIINKMKNIFMSPSPRGRTIKDALSSNQAGCFPLFKRGEKCAANLEEAFDISMLDPAHQRALAQRM